jgi:hypothetical protein
MARYKTWSAWWHGLLAVIVGGIATAGSTYVAALLTGLDLKPKQFALTIGIAALVQAFAYLKESPLPFDDTEPTQPPTETKP